MPVYRNIGEFLEFIDISKNEFKLFHWQPENSFKRFDLDINVVKDNRISDIFVHKDKGNMKIVHIKKDHMFYIVGANIEVQFQLLEALLEHIEIEFNKMYDVNTVLSYGHYNPNMFNGFKEKLESIIVNFADLELVKRIMVECRVCKTILPLFVKKSMIQNADSYPVPLVYDHEGHAILCFIDKNFQHRGVELVNITG
ncbi:MAG: hypothetical protein ACFFEN_09390 [Candidatus Thorarchaeota archaeon]